MRKALTASIALSLSAWLVGPMLGSGVAQAQEKQAVSKASAKPLKAAQEAIQAKKYEEALARLREVEALPNRTAYDSYVMNELFGFAYYNSGKTTEAAKAFEATLESGLLPPASVTPRLKQLMGVYYVQKNYEKSAEYGNRLIKQGSADENTYTVVAQSYFLNNDFKNSSKFLEDYVSDLTKRGQQPKEQTLQLLSESYLKANNTAGGTATLEKLVTYYPKPNYWNNLLFVLRTDASNSDRLTLNIYRLMLETGILKEGADFIEMAQLTQEGGNPGEAVRVLEQGVAANVFTEPRDKDRVQRMLVTFKAAAAKDQADLANQEKMAAAAKMGEADVRVGQTYLNYGQYDKAVATIQRGISKGGLRFPEESQLLLGIAQLKLKNKDEAIKAFTAIKGGDAKYARLGNLWSLHAKASAS